MTAMTLSDRQRKAFELIAQAAREKRPCPTNWNIARHLNMRNAAAGCAVYHELVKKGCITTERLGNGRVTTIVSTGDKTTPMLSPNRTGLAAEETVKKLAIRAEKRDPCFACGVPLDRHEASGCKRWRGMM